MSRSPFHSLHKPQVFLLMRAQQCQKNCSTRNFLAHQIKEDRYLVPLKAEYFRLMACSALHSQKDLKITAGFSDLLLALCANLQIKVRPDCLH